MVELLQGYKGTGVPNTARSFPTRFLPKAGTPLPSRRMSEPPDVSSYLKKGGTGTVSDRLISPCTALYRFPAKKISAKVERMVGSYSVKMAQFWDGASPFARLCPVNGGAFLRNGSEKNVAFCRFALRNVFFGERIHGMNRTHGTDVPPLRRLWTLNGKYFLREEGYCATGWQKRDSYGRLIALQHDYE
jgi:hypothetical protein